MKIFAVLVLAAIVAYASAEETTPAAVPKYVGDLQDGEGGDVVRIGVYNDCDIPTGGDADNSRALPTCLIPGKLGEVACLAECIFRGHKGGHCQGSKCVCTD